jgi:glycosyltransferase involved in cell wall biosynthesis
MRILLATALSPFAYGGAEILAEGLRCELARRGHDVDLLSLPFDPSDPALTPEHILSARLLDLELTPGLKPDAVIGLKFPAYLLRHPRKVVWLLHQMRAVYDLWHDPALGWAGHPAAPLLRSAIAEADRHLAEARRLFAISSRVAERLRHFNGLEAQVLMPPVLDAELFEVGPAQGPLLYPSRLDPTKRHELVLEALAQTRTAARLQLVFPHARASYAARLRALGAELGLDERLEWTGAVDRAELRRLYATCRGVVFTPLDEDYGFVTVEAMLSARPVITCRDSGGARTLVEDGANGWVVEPTPRAVARALDELWEHPEEAQRRGQAGRIRVLNERPGWPATVDTLLAPLEEPTGTIPRPLAAAR